MTEEQLIEGILNGDQKHFKALVDNYQSLVINTCNSFLHDQNDAEDMTQEVFIEAFLSIHKFNHKSKLSTWLYRISVNKSLNFIRDNKKRRIIKSIGDFFSGEQNSELKTYHNDLNNSEFEDIQEQKIELLHRSIQALSRQQKIAFTLSKIDNLSYLQIAEVMNLSVSAVEGLIHRAKVNVQKKLINSFKAKPSSSDKE